jgi:hypothetical protein
MEAGLSVQAVILKQPMSSRLAVAAPRRSTHAEEPRMDLAVAMLHATDGTPTTSRCTR